MDPTTGQAYGGNMGDCKSKHDDRSRQPTSKWSFPSANMLSRERVAVHGKSSTAGAAVRLTEGGFTSSFPLSPRVLEKQRKKDDNQSAVRSTSSDMGVEFLEVLEDQRQYHPSDKDDQTQEGNDGYHRQPYCCHEDIHRPRPHPLLLQPQQEGNSVEGYSSWEQSSTSSTSCCGTIDSSQHQRRSLVVLPSSSNQFSQEYLRPGGTTSEAMTATPATESSSDEGSRYCYCSHDYSCSSSHSISAAAKNCCKPMQEYFPQLDVDTSAAPRPFFTSTSTEPAPNTKPLFVHRDPASDPTKLHRYPFQPQHPHTTSRSPSSSRSPSPSPTPLPSPYLTLRARQLQASASRPVSSCSEFSNFSTSTTTSSCYSSSNYPPTTPLKAHSARRLASYPSTCLCVVCVNHPGGQCLKDSKQPHKQARTYPGSIDSFQAESSNRPPQSHHTPNTVQDPSGSGPCVAEETTRSTYYTISTAALTTTTTTANNSRRPSAVRPLSVSIDCIEVEPSLTEKSRTDYYYYYRELERLAEHYDARRRSQRAVLIQGLLNRTADIDTSTNDDAGATFPADTITNSRLQLGRLEYLSLIEGLNPKSQQYQRNKAATKRKRARVKKDDSQSKRNSWVRFRSLVSLLLESDRKSEVDSGGQQQEALFEELQQQWRQSHLSSQDSEDLGDQLPSSSPRNSAAVASSSSHSLAGGVISSRSAPSLALHCDNPDDQCTLHTSQSIAARAWTPFRQNRGSQVHSRALRSSALRFSSVSNGNSEGYNSSPAVTEGSSHKQQRRKSKFLLPWRLRHSSSSTPLSSHSTHTSTPSTDCSNSSISSSRPITSPSTLSPSPSFDSLATSASNSTLPTLYTSSRTLSSTHSSPSLLEQSSHIVKKPSDPRVLGSNRCASLPSSRSSPSLARITTPKALSASFSTRARSEIMTSSTPDSTRPMSPGNTTGSNTSLIHPKTIKRPSTPASRHPLAEVIFSEDCEGQQWSEDEPSEAEDQPSPQSSTSTNGIDGSTAVDETVSMPKSPASIPMKSLEVGDVLPLHQKDSLLANASVLADNLDMTCPNKDKEKMQMMRGEQMDDRLTAALSVNSSTEQPHSPVATSMSRDTCSLSSSSAIDLTSDPSNLNARPRLSLGSTDGINGSNNEDQKEEAQAHSQHSLSPLESQCHPLDPASPNHPVAVPQPSNNPERSTAAKSLTDGVTPLHSPQTSLDLQPRQVPSSNVEEQVPVNTVGQQKSGKPSSQSPGGSRLQLSRLLRHRSYTNSGGNNGVRSPLELSLTRSTYTTSPVSSPTATQSQPLSDPTTTSSSTCSGTGRNFTTNSSASSSSVHDGKRDRKSDKPGGRSERPRSLMLPRLTSDRSDGPSSHGGRNTTPASPSRPQPPRSASCDERNWSVGPPDPVPDYYRHLQVRRDNRRRRSAPLLRSSPPSCTSSSQFLIGGPTPSGAPSIAMVMDGPINTPENRLSSGLTGLGIQPTDQRGIGSGAAIEPQTRSSIQLSSISRDGRGSAVSTDSGQPSGQGGEQQEHQQQERPERKLLRRSMSALSLQSNLSSMWGKILTTVTSVIPPTHPTSMNGEVDGGSSNNCLNSGYNTTELGHHAREQSMTSRRSQEVLHNPLIEVGGRISLSGRSTPTRDPYEHLRRHPMYQQRLYFYSDCDDDNQLVQQAHNQLYHQLQSQQAHTTSSCTLRHHQHPQQEQQTSSHFHQQSLHAVEDPMSPPLSATDRSHSRVCSEATSDHPHQNHSDSHDVEHGHDDDEEEEDIGHEPLSRHTAETEVPEVEDDDVFAYPQNARVRDDIAADQANQALEDEEEMLASPSSATRPIISFERTVSSMSASSSSIEMTTETQVVYRDDPPAYAIAVGITSAPAKNRRRRSEELLRPSASRPTEQLPSRASTDGFVIVERPTATTSTATSISTSPQGIPIVKPIRPLTLANLNLSNPPSYWEAVIKYRGFPKIQPRPEEGNEVLPRYSCSVFREGCINRKTELIGSWRPYRRPWKRTFAHLRGTSLRLYAVDEDDVPRVHIRNISLQLARCELATDYKQRQHVIRIRSTDRTMLMECKDRVDALTWLEHLQAAANIATPLEERCMPKFYTLSRPGSHGNAGLSRSNTQRQDQQQQQQQQHQQQHQQQARHHRQGTSGASASSQSHQQAANIPHPEANEHPPRQAHQRSRTTTSTPRCPSSPSYSPSSSNTSKRRETRTDSHGHCSSDQRHRHEDDQETLSERRRVASANDVPSTSSSARHGASGGIRSLLLRRVGHSNTATSSSSTSTAERDEDGPSSTMATPRPSSDQQNQHQPHGRREHHTVTTLADLARVAAVTEGNAQSSTSTEPTTAEQHGNTMDDEQVLRAFLQSIGHDDDDSITSRSRSRTLDLSRDRRGENQNQGQAEGDEDDDDDELDENLLDDDDIDIEELVELHRRRIRRRERRERERRRAAEMLLRSEYGGDGAAAESSSSWRRHSVDLIRRHVGAVESAVPAHLGVSSSPSSSVRSSWNRPLRVLHQLLGQSSPATTASNMAAAGQSS